MTAKITLEQFKATHAVLCAELETLKPEQDERRQVLFAAIRKNSLDYHGEWKRNIRIG